MLTDTVEYQYQLDDAFFLDLDAPEVQKGQVNVTLKVRKTSGVYQLDFHTEGEVVVICDRCLDEMEQPIETTDRLKVKLGAEYSEEDDSDDDFLMESADEPQEIDPRWNELKKILDNN